jgi:hypothetical protein
MLRPPVLHKILEAQESLVALSALMLSVSFHMPLQRNLISYFNIALWTSQRGSASRCDLVCFLMLLKLRRCPKARPTKVASKTLVALLVFQQLLLGRETLVASWAAAPIRLGYLMLNKMSCEVRLSRESLGAARD